MRAPSKPKGPRIPPFIKLPSNWIDKERGLRNFRWSQATSDPNNLSGSDYTAGLLLLIIIAHRTDETGVARITYDEMQAAVSISRAKVANGLKALIAHGIIQPLESQSMFRLVNFGVEGQNWGKLPAKLMYHDGRLRPFKDFKLRRAVELHALKIYLLFIARRDTKTNEVRLNWKHISEWCGVPTDQIKGATSLLIENRLISVDSITAWETWNEKHTQPNCYRIAYIDPWKNHGTQRNGDLNAVADEKVAAALAAAPFQHR